MADRRPGTAGAAKLLKSSEVTEWKVMLDKYDEAVARVARAKKKPELVTLDKWLWNEFPLLVMGRSPPSCRKQDLVRVMQWKLLRGKNRPALLHLIKQNSDSSIDSVSTEAFQLLLSGKSSSWKAAVSKLAELRGVGPATASAVLAALSPAVPFMADEPLEAVTRSKRDYTLAAYTDMHGALHALSKDVLHNFLSPEAAGKAMWAAAMLSIHPPTGVGTGTGAVLSSPPPPPQQQQKKKKRARAGVEDVATCSKRGKCTSPAGCLDDGATAVAARVGTGTGADDRHDGGLAAAGGEADKEPAAATSSSSPREERRAKRAKLTT